MDDICYRAEKTLHDLHHHIIPNESYPLKKLSDLITSLIVNQRPVDTFITSGNHWSLMDEEGQSDPAPTQQFSREQIPTGKSRRLSRVRRQLHHLVVVSIMANQFHARLQII